MFYYYLQLLEIYCNHFLGLFKIINAANTPGIHPKIVKMKTIITDPHPLSITARGGNKIESKTLQKLIIYFDLIDDYILLV